MSRLKGKTVCRGVVMGPVVLLTKAALKAEKRQITDPGEEQARLKAASDRAMDELQALYDKALEELGEDGADVFEAHQMMLEELTDLAAEKIAQEGVNAEFAAEEAGKEQAALLAEMEDEYMRERAQDVREVAERLLRILMGKGGSGTLQEPSIVLAKELTPGETVGLDKSKILALVMSEGSANSHSAILARMLNIPALIRVPFVPADIRDGATAIVDGDEGLLILEPGEEEIKQTKERIAGQAAERAALAAVKGLESVTRSGRRIEIAANIGNVSDLEYVKEADADGIGLFRSEFLYLGRKDYPTEEEQLKAYRKALEEMHSKRVVIRTCDIGADKQADYFGLPHEENPALGLRAIRVCLTRPEMFKTQIRALLRAAVYGNLSVMYPMIISCDEVKRIKEIVEECAEELEKENIPYARFAQGIMIETPAAVMISDELAKLVDFFSVGTNDLTQYTLAIDRMNETLESFLDTHHPAILRMIGMAAENAHKEGKWIGICGELGADPTLTEEFLRMGIDELSVSPSMVLPLRKRVRELN